MASVSTSKHEVFVWIELFDQTTGELVHARRISYYRLRDLVNHDSYTVGDIRVSMDGLFISQMSYEFRLRRPSDCSDRARNVRDRFTHRFSDYIYHIRIAN